MVITTPPFAEVEEQELLADCVMWDLKRSQAQVGFYVDCRVVSQQQSSPCCAGLFLYRLCRTLMGSKGIEGVPGKKRFRSNYAGCHMDVKSN